MSPIAIILIVISAFMHAGWNVLSKSRHPSTAFFFITTIAGMALLSPFLAWHHRALAGIPPRAWMLLGGTGFFMAVYYSSLAGAYRSGHMSVAYPIARASPLIVVSVVALALGRGRQISCDCVLGIVLVVAGCFLVPMRRFSEFRARNYVNAACGLALLAAVGTAGYTILDDEALRSMRNAPAIKLGIWQTTLLYGALETISCALWTMLGMGAGGARAERLLKEWRENGWSAVVAGLAIWGCYLLVLVSLAFVRNVSYVAAFRQLSIPLGVAFGILVLKEPVSAPKIAGTMIMFVGLVLVAVG